MRRLLLLFIVFIIGTSQIFLIVAMSYTLIALKIDLIVVIMLLIIL